MEYGGASFTRRDFLARTAAGGVGAVTALAARAAQARAAAREAPLRIGLIGLDTTHVIAFTRYINDPANNTGCRVTAAFQGGSPDFPPSANRIDGFTKRIQDDYDVTLVPSIAALCEQVDAVLLESVDGRPHLAQARPVIAAGKPLFVDKPVAASLGDVMEIFRLAEAAGVSCWSSSAMRFGEGVMALRENSPIGGIVGCDVYGSCPLSDYHPDLYFYGIHAVEILFAVMGPGCDTVQRIYTPDTDIVIGTWRDGRMGTFRGIRKGKGGTGGTAYGAEGIASTGGFGSYAPLIRWILESFRTGVAPVPAEETINLYAFMSAADASRARNGRPVSVASVVADAARG